MKGEGEGMGGRRKGRTGMHSLPRRVSGTSPAFKSPRGTPPMLPSWHPQGKRTRMEDALPNGRCFAGRWLGSACVVEIRGPSLFSIRVPPPHLSSAWAFTCKTEALETVPPLALCLRSMRPFNCRPLYSLFLTPLRWRRPARASLGDQVEKQPSF